ncbi:hypothetical protein Mal4_34860 [Maioricimonas rarisocia]|uniref:Uncharacterized protein n=1 Tax=Maioricimonas rarisocia TaxID=2528026 RepID=A0A517Z9P9_9PLAN|nr:hypothetical protein Mal4_34860 [Maioricimonas rarisocia]
MGGQLRSAQRDCSTIIGERAPVIQDGNRCTGGQTVQLMVRNEVTETARGPCHVRVSATVLALLRERECSRRPAVMVSTITCCEECLSRVPWTRPGR